MKRSSRREGNGTRPGAELHTVEAAAASRQLPVLLHRTREALAVHFRKVFVLHDLTDPQWRVLRILGHSDELDVSNLALKSYLMRESLSRILRDLGERGLIVRRVSNTDARRFFHTLTAKGRHLLEEVAPAFNPVFREIEARFGVERIEDLNRRLAQLLEAIQSDVAEGAESGAAPDDETPPEPKVRRRRTVR
jgi:homoprotocatechuate degradation regulator HpaR